MFRCIATSIIGPLFPLPLAAVLALRLFSSAAIVVLYCSSDDDDYDDDELKESNLRSSIQFPLISLGPPWLCLEILANYCNRNDQLEVVAVVTLVSISPSPFDLYFPSSSSSSSFDDNDMEEG